MSLFAIVKLTLGGSIQNYDLSMDYSNLGYTSQYKIMFKVQTSFLDEQNDAIRLLFPNPIHDPSQSLSVFVYSATLSYLDKSTPPTTVTLTAKKMRVDSNGRYYFFFNYKLDNTFLYTLTINTNPLGADLNQKLLTNNSILEIETIMDYNSDNTFIYDYNPNFAVIRYTNAPERNIQFTVDATVSDFAFKPGGVYPVFFNIITTKAYYGNVKFEISFIPQEFQLTQFCYSVKDTLIDAIEPSLYSCSFKNGKLVFEYYSDYIPQNFAIRIASIAQNANRIVKNIGFTLRVILKDGSHITDEVSKENMFELQQLFLSKTQVNLSFGIPIDTQVSPNFLICLIRNTNTDQGSSIFNAIRFIFQINQDTPIGQELEIQVKVPSGSDGDNDSYVLVQSISENLPNLSDSQKVQCSVVNNLISTKDRYIRCINIGQLIPAKDYHIGFRFYLSYDESQSNLPTNFSELSILTVSYQNGVRSVDSISLNIQQPITKAQIRTLNANSWSYSYYNQTVVSTQEYNSATKAAQFKRPYLSGGTLGIIPSSISQKLIFSLDIPNEDLTTRDMSLPQEVPFSAGVQIAINPQVTFDTNTEINSYSLLNQNISHAINYGSNYFTLLKVYASTTDALSKLFTRNDFSITSAKINFRTTPNALDTILDFYIMSYDQILSETPTLGGQYLANAYTVDFSVPSSKYKLAIINQYKGKTFGNSPTVVPTLLKVSITFDSSDISSGNKGFIIFFDGGSFLDDVKFQNQETTVQDVECGTSILTTSTTYKGYRTIQSTGSKVVNHGLIYQNMNQLIISNVQLSSSNQVTIILPILLSQYSDEFEVYVGTFQLNPDYKILQKDNYITYDKIYRLSASSQNLIEADTNSKRRLIFGNQMSSLANFPNDAQFSDITKNTIGLQNLNLIGDTLTITIDLKFADKDSTYLYKNDDDKTFLQGAAFTLITSWKFFNSNMDQDCFFFPLSYKKSDNPSKILQKYIMYCPLVTSDTSNLQQIVNNFLVPNKSIQTPFDTTFAISNTRGYLRYATQYSQNINNPNEINVTIDSGKLFWGTKDNLIKYQVTQLKSSIPLEIGMKMRIVQSFKKQYLLHGQQCMFYDPTLQVFEKACRVELEPSNLYQVDFYLESTCTYCSFSSSFVIYHYGNEIILNGSDDQDKTFSMSICLNFVKDGQNQCQALATTTTQPSFKFESLTITPPQKLNIKSNKIEFKPETKSQISEISLSFGFNYQSVDRQFFNANLFDRIIFNLGTFGVYNKQLFDQSVMTRICKVYQDIGDNNPQISSLFTSLNSIDSNTGGSLLLSLKQDLKDISQFILKCSNVRYPDSTLILPINIQIKDYLYTKIYQQSDNYQFNTPFKEPKNFALGYPIISKILGNSQGSISTIYFSIKTSSTRLLNNKSSIFVTLPFNYDINNDLKYKLACKVNAISVDCFLDSWNTLRFSGIPQQTSNILSVVLSGARLPKYNENAFFSFLILFDFNNPLDYEEGYASSINESVTKTLPLIINSMTLENQILDRLSSYSFYLTVNSTYIVSQAYFQINFPSIWQISNDENVSQCLIKDISTDNILGQFCRREGSNVIFKIYSGNSELTSASAASSLSTLLLYVTNINNPEQWSSNIVFTKPSISLIDSLTGASVYFGDSYLMNTDSVDFQKEEDTQQLGWFDRNGNQIFEVDAVNGVFQAQIFLRPIDITKSFQGQLSISLSQTSQQKLSIYPDVPICSIGDISLQVFIGGNPTTREGQYVAMFYKITDSFNLYSNIPSLKINVKNNKVSINYSIQKLRLPKLGTSPPIILDLSDQRIMESITIKPVDNTRIIVIKGQTMTFDAFTVQQIFQFQVQEEINESSFSIEFTASGDGQSYMQADNKISIEVDLNEYQYTKLSISKDVTKVGTTSYPINFTCNNQGIIYYRVSQKNQPPANLSTIKDKAITQYQVFQEQFNLIEKYGYILSNQAQVTVIMDNLISLQYYKVEGFCETFKGDKSDKSNLDFQTSDNNSRLNQFTIQFKSVLTETQKRRLCCIIAEFLTIPSSLIYLREGTKCKDSQLRISFVSPIPLLKEQAGKVVIYIAPLNYLPDTSYFQYMIAAIKNKENFKTVLAQNIPNLPKLDSISEISPLDYSEVSFDLTVPDEIVVGIYNITISNLKLTQNGFIYLALEELSESSIKPDIGQLRRGVNYQGTVFQNGMQVVYQNEKLYKQSKFFFDQLKNNTHYIIYFMGGSEYQDDLTTFTEVFTRQFQTLNTQQVVLEVQNTHTNILSILYSTLIFLLIFII